MSPFLPWVATAVCLLVVGILTGIAVEAARPVKIIERRPQLQGAFQVDGLSASP